MTVTDGDLDLTWVPRLEQREAGWNGYDAQPPDPFAIDHAARWLRQWHARVPAAEWVMPHVTSSANGEVVFEWFHRKKTLTLYVTAEAVDYVRAWGPDMEAEMEDGTLEEGDRMATLWWWLWEEGHGR